MYSNKKQFRRMLLLRSSGLVQQEVGRLKP